MFKTRLNASRSEIEDMVRSNPIGATVIDGTSGQMTMANDAFLEIIGAKSETQLLQYRREDTWANPDDHKYARACILDRRKLVNFEVQRKRLDGTIRWVLINSQPTTIHKKPAYILWQIDITDRILAQKAAEENENYFRTLFDASPVAIGITREADNQIIYGNDVYAQLLGYEGGDLATMNAADVWASPEERDQIKILFEKQGFISREIVRGRHKDGSIIWLSISWKHFKYKGEDSHLFWAYDITQQKENEVALTLAKEEAEQATHAKSAFLATMSHEIRTPLNGVLGLAELLKSSPLQPEQCERVDSILDTGQSLLGIINDVLDMSKIESGNMELEEHIFDLGDLLNSVIPPLNTLADKKKLLFKTTLDIEENVVLSGDATRLRQIVWNLLSNAIKFTDSGLVSFSVEKITPDQAPPAVQLAEKDLYICFEVKDTGAGISRDRLEMIFDAFTQADNSINRKFGGTGLGLSIVKRLVDLMGGAIQAQSEVGSGSIFTAYLPFDTPDMDTRLEQPQLMVVDENASYRICVAEDNSINAQIVTAFLEAAGHQVRIFENGRLAVDASDDNWADLYLMDVHMPEMNGIEATEALRAKGVTIPIVGVTAEAFTDSHNQFKAAGMNTVLTKPYKADQLYEIIAKVMACT